MVLWDRLLNGRDFEQTPGDGKGQGSLVSMGLQRVQQTEQLNSSIHTEKYTCHKRTVGESSQFIISM